MISLSLHRRHTLSICYLSSQCSQGWLLSHPIKGFVSLGVSLVDAMHFPCSPVFLSLLRDERLSLLYFFCRNPCLSLLEESFTFMQLTLLGTVAHSKDLGPLVSFTALSFCDRTNTHTHTHPTCIACFLFSVYISSSLPTSQHTQSIMTTFIFVPLCTRTLASSPS